MGRAWRRGSLRGAEAEVGSRLRQRAVFNTEGTEGREFRSEKEERKTAMVVLKYLLVILGIGLFGSAGALVAYDVYVRSQLRRLLRRRREESVAGGGALGLSGSTTGAPASAAGYFSADPFGPVRWQRALLLAVLAALPLLVSPGIA